MHELSIAMGLIELASEQAARLGDVRVNAVHVRIGRLSGVVSDALRFSFELAAAGTPIEEARLEIEDVEVELVCAACRIETPGALDDLRCPRCGGPATIQRGRELELRALEVVDAAPNR